MHTQMQQCFQESEIQKILDPSRKISMNTPTCVISETEKTWVDIIKPKYNTFDQSSTEESSFDNLSHIKKLEKTSQKEQISQSISNLEEKLVLRINQNKLNCRMDIIESSFSKMTDLFSKNFESITNKLDQIANQHPPGSTNGQLSNTKSTTANASLGFAGGKHP